MPNRVEPPLAPRYLVGARYVCTKCKTRGVTRACACGAKAHAVDITSPAGAWLFAELTKPPTSQGAPTRDELFWGGLKSIPQWCLSFAIALVIGVWAAHESEWSLRKVGLAALEVVLLTLLFRLPVLAFALLFRVLVAVSELVWAACCFVAGKLAGRSALVAAASNWLVRAEQTLSGDYFWRRSMVELRAPRSGTEASLRGAIPSDEALSLLVSTGSHGALVLGDGEAPAFPIVLESGERVIVSVEVGSLRLHGAVRFCESEGTGASPFMRESQKAMIAKHAEVTVAGGEWSEREVGAGYRDPLEPRRLRGTEERPLVVELG